MEVQNFEPGCSHAPATRAPAPLSKCVRPDPPPPPPCRDVGPSIISRVVAWLTLGVIVAAASVTFGYGVLSMNALR